MKKTEKWTPIPDFDGYFITDDWRCYSAKKNDYIGSENADGYIQLNLSNRGAIRQTKLHIIIAEMFVPMPDRYKDVPREEMVVHHKDFNPHNNDPSNNLMWMTRSEHNELHRNSDMTRKRISDGKVGIVFSKEHKRKLSEAKKGEKHPNYGKHLSEETRNRIGKSNKGRIVSEDTRKKQSDAHKGTTPSNAKSVAQIDITTGEIIEVFSSAMAAAKRTGNNNTNISAVCRGIHNHCGGYRWAYLN